MNKQLIFAAIACVALAGCSNEEYLGEFNPNNTSQGIPNAINFSSVAPTITRAEGQAAALELGYSFQVYATKTVGTGGSAVTSNVFAQSTASPITNDNTYWAWYNTETANTTTSNTANWEYVGAAGDKDIPNSGKFTLSTAQTIKYWDYSASRYDFVAFKAIPVGAPTATAATISNITTTGFTVEGTAAQLAALYIADKKEIHKEDYNKVVQFTFRNAAAKVRIGFYETIPGYVVNNVKFYYSSGSSNSTEGAYLDGKFVGNNTTGAGKYTVTFGSPSTFARDNTTTFQTYHDFGALTYAETDEALGTGIGITSTTPTWAGNNTTTNYYSYMLPNPNTSDVDNMILLVDYDLYNSKSQETIHVKGAKAVVPADYMTWKSNYAYTYLFKISDNTNGTTGTTGDPVGLYPITFDAVTVATTDGSQGTITTVTTPAITTYQAGSVSDAGITYANAKGPIYITVNTNGTLATLNAEGTTVKLYTVASGTTEADLMLLSAYPKTDVSTNLSILSTSETVPETTGVTFAANTTAKFTPADGQTYAVEYSKAAVNYTPDDADLHNAVLTGAISTSTSLTSEQATTLNGLSGVSKTTYAADENPTAEDAKLYNAQLEGAVSTTTVKTPAVKVYKIIKIG